MGVFWLSCCWYVMASAAQQVTSPYDLAALLAFYLGIGPQVIRFIVGGGPLFTRTDRRTPAV